MTRVWIAHCLCGPNRHAIAALAGEFETEAEASAGLLSKLRRLITELNGAGTLNPWCGICGSLAWRYEVGVTRWRTMAEAETYLRRVEAENIAANLVYGTHGSKPPGSA